MVTKIIKAFMVMGALVMVLLAVSNFLPEAKSSSLWGTTEEISTAEELWHYYEIYGIEGLADRHIEGDLYCVDDPLNCVIVI